MKINGMWDDAWKVSEGTSISINISYDYKHWIDTKEYIRKKKITIILDNVRKT